MDWINVDEMLRWQWLIFELPLAFGLTLFMGSLLGIDAGDADLDDADLDVDGDAGDAEGDHHAGMTARVLGLMGVGRVPLILVLSTLGLTFGATGCLLLRSFSLSFLPFAVPIAFVVMFFCTRWIALTVAAVMPQTETYVSKTADLVGAAGKLTIAADAKYGEVEVIDQFKHTLKHRCWTEEERLPIGTEVVLLDWTADKGFRIQQINWEEDT